jgi:hypothetical protein
LPIGYVERCATVGYLDYVVCEQSDTMAWLAWIMVATLTLPMGTGDNGASPCFMSWGCVMWCGNLRRWS